jgi:hypothetical protein
MDKIACETSFFRVAAQLKLTALWAAVSSSHRERAFVPRGGVVFRSLLRVSQSCRKRQGPSTAIDRFHD